MEVARTELPLCYYTPFYLNVDNNRDAWDKCRLKNELIVIMEVLRFSFFGWGENLVSLFLDDNFLFNLMPHLLMDLCAFKFFFVVYILSQMENLYFFPSGTGFIFNFTGDFVTELEDSSVLGSFSVSVGL